MKNYDIEYKIADARSSLAKELNHKFYPDHEYTGEELDGIFEEVSKNMAANGRIKFEYLRESMPRPDELRSIVEDMLEFYENNFKTYTSETIHAIELRFFVHVRFMDEDGDAQEKSIRIGCKNFAECGNTNASVQKFLDKIPYDKKEYFKNRLRVALAHELYHSLHMRHCSLVDKEFGKDVYEKILSEIFANYFAYAYLDDFLLRTEGADGAYYNQKRNDVIDWYKSSRYFGVGRKRLFPETFAKAEIEKDDHEFQCLLKDKEISQVFYTNADYVLDAEYSAGYVLDFHGRKYEEGRTGRNMELYNDLYRKYLAGEAKEALLQLIAAKEKEYFTYKYKYVN